MDKGTRRALAKLLVLVLAEENDALTSLAEIVQAGLEEDEAWFKAHEHDVCQTAACPRSAPF